LNLSRSALFGALLLAWAFYVCEGFGAEGKTRSLFVAPCDHTNGIYRLNEPIRWTTSVAGTNDVAYSVKRGGLTVLARDKLPPTRRAEITASLDQPGTVLFEIKTRDGEGNSLKTLGGAIVAPERIQPSSPPPEDFDRFWKEKLEELAKVPAHPQLVAGESDKAGVNYWNITMQNIRGSHVHGQLATPLSPGKKPAMIILQGAGVYALQKSWVTHRAAKGWIALNLIAHDLPVSEPAEFYEKQFQGDLKDYWLIGNNDREKSYFLRMYLACHRGTQYLTERPDWDGRTLVAIGTSQGGQQAIVTAALHPKVTAVIACVPGGCDLTGKQAGRSPGWPAQSFEKHGSDPARILEATRYYDVVNFARRVQCPVLAAAGLIDEVCPPEGIVAAVNQLPGPHELVILPGADHMGVNNSHQPFNDRSKEWVDALYAGRPVPVQALRQP
jgi:cephalosporin-C deacetylase